MGLIRDAFTVVTLSLLLLLLHSSNAFVSQTPVGVWGCSSAGISKPTARTTTTTSRYSSVLQDRLSGEDIQARLQQQLAKLKEKDLASRTLSKEVRFSFKFRRDQNQNLVSVRWHPTRGLFIATYFLLAASHLVFPLSHHRYSPKMNE
jgi:hypothetical protein